MNSKYGNWPMKPSVRWPGEMTIQCPHCSSQDITLTGAYKPTPWGPGRCGDGMIEWAECRRCLARGYLDQSTKLEG